LEAGLSWITILRKRESYRSAFDDFEPSKIAGYGERKLAELLDNPGIIRNRLKIEAAVVNAKAFIEVQRHFGSFDTYIWQFVNHTPVQNAREGMGDIRQPHVTRFPCRCRWLVSRCASGPGPGKRSPGQTG
jgi:DNA-3-methyladenine glycosylase I